MNFGMAELVKRELLKHCNMSKLSFYEHCMFGKHKRVKFNASVHTNKCTLDYVHADLWGLHVSPLMVVLVICLLSLVITLKEFGLIS